MKLENNNAISVLKSELAQLEKKKKKITLPDTPFMSQPDWDRINKIKAQQMIIRKLLRKLIKL